MEAGAGLRDLGSEAGVWSLDEETFKADRT